MDEAAREDIVTGVERAMRSFEAAERALDAETLIAHFAASPDFHIYNDGQRVSYEAMVANVRCGFPRLRAIAGGFHGLQVLVVAPDAALATAGFREAVTDADGVTTRLCGAATWLWRRIDGRWRIVYGHTDHYPDTAGE